MQTGGFIRRYLWACASPGGKAVSKGIFFSGDAGGRTKKAILADAMEAIIGAFYLDSGYREAEKFVLKFITNEVEKVINNRHQKDYKTLLQEVKNSKFFL